jgi:hypothetical protein
LSAKPKKPEEMRYAELGDYRDPAAQRCQTAAADGAAAREDRDPVATLIIILFGAPLASSSSRAARRHRHLAGRDHHVPDDVQGDRGRRHHGQPAGIRRRMAAECRLRRRGRGALWRIRTDRRGHSRFESRRVA